MNEKKILMELFILCTLFLHTDEIRHKPNDSNLFLYQGSYFGFNVN